MTKNATHTSLVLPLVYQPMHPKSSKRKLLFFFFFRNPIEKLSAPLLFSLGIRHHGLFSPPDPCSLQNRSPPFFPKCTFYKKHTHDTDSLSNKTLPMVSILLG